MSAQLSYLRVWSERCGLGLGSSLSGACKSRVQRERLNSHYLTLEAEGPAFSENNPNTHQMPASMACQDEPSNLECIHKSELFPKKELVTEDRYLQFPFPLLCGESVEYLGKIDDGIIALSNFRVLIKCKDLFANVPIGLIEFVETRDIFHIAIYCKDATVVKCSFATNELCQDWFKRLNAVITAPTRMEDLFAFAFHAWCVDHCNREQNSSCYQLCVQNSPVESYQLRFGKEVKRMNFDLKSAWRISYINEDYEICPSYPEVHIVPAIITDEELKNVASFRSMRRIPSVVWRDQRSGAVISRSSQPEIGWLGWRKTEDENLLQAIAMACARNPGTNSKFQSQADITESTEGIDKDEMTMGIRENSTNALGMLIIDARSYSAAIANRAKGGGCECAEYYPNCEIQFMNLANIHSIRKSFCALRTLCGSSPDQTNWLSGLENTKWLHHIANLLKAACVVASAIHKEGRPVLVHCSDGWDRTPQIVALAELLLDPYYRTSYGFYVLVEREWLQFGHKFADRCGHDVNNGDSNERCPVFLQWLDCVHQIYRQFPCAFEFSEAFLIKLVQHTYSRLFGTFLCNNANERKKAKLKTKTASVWSLLLPGNKRFTNSLYNPSTDQVLYPSCHVLNLTLWTHVFLSNNSFSTSSDDIVGTNTNDHFLDEHNKVDHNNLGKTRSYDDLVGVEHPAYPNRRLSDPNIAVDNHEQAMFPPKECSNSVYSLINVNSNHLLEETSASPPRELLNGNHCTSTPDSEPADNIEEGNSEMEYQIKFGEELLNGDILTNLTNREVNGNSSLPSYITSVSSKPHRTLNKSSQVPVNETFSNSISPIVDEPLNKLTNHKNTCTAKTSSSSSTADLPANVYMNGNVEHQNSSSSSSNSSSSSSSSSSEDDDYSAKCNEERTLQIYTSISTSTSDISDSRIDANGGDSSSSSSLAVPPEVSPADTEYKSIPRSSLKFNYLFESKMNISKTKSCPSTPNIPMAQCLKRTLTPVTPAAESKVQPLLKQCSTAQNQSSFNVTRHLDPDGLTTHPDTVQQRVNEIRSDYHQTIEIQKRHLEQLATLYQASAFNGTVRQISDKDELRCCYEIPLLSYLDDKEKASLPESSGSGEPHSLGHCSNAASDVSWEHIDEKDSRMTLWVPDHAVTHCAGCEAAFWFVRRKHHCRNCGKVFCGKCANTYMPIPHQQLLEPARVCRSCLPKLQSSFPDTYGFFAFEQPLVAAAAAAGASSN